MKKVRLKINNLSYCDDFAVLPPPRKLLKLEIEEELDDIIPSAEIELKRDAESGVKFSQGQIVQIAVSSDDTKRLFYGPIMDIKRDNKTIKIQANMETIELLRKKVNQLYRYFGESD